MKQNIRSLIALLVFLLYPFLLKLLPIDRNLVLNEVFMWLLLLLIVLWIYLVEKRTIASIGWQKMTAKMTLGGIGLGVVMFILFGVSTVAIQAIGLPLNQETAQLIAGQSVPFLLLIALRAGVVEEVVYRGYAFERMYELTTSKWVAALVPVIFFTLAHLSWGLGHLVFVFIAGGLFMLVYVAKRNLALVITAHFITDVITVLILPMLLGS